jgi:hypothetical protein
LSPACELRPTGEADLPALSALFARRFGHPLSALEWEWKYRRSPGDGRSLVAVAGSEVVAHAGALRLPARWRGGEGGIWQLTDFAGEAGGTGSSGLRPPLVALGRRLLAGLPGSGDAPWIFGFPSERHFRLGAHVFGYRPLAVVQPLAGTLPDAAVSPSAPAAPASLEVADHCGDWAEAVWERCAVLGVRRSAAFLNWRYHARPERYYRFYRLREGGAEGLLVFAFVGAEAWAAEVWLPAGAEWYPSLLVVAADLRASGLGTWRFWPGLPERLPAALGLTAAGEPLLLGCRGRAGGPDPVLAAQGFTYAMGDYDLA